MPINKLRFDMFALLECTAAVGIAFLLISCSGEFRSVTWRFTSLPPNDSALDQWLVDNGYNSVSVERESNCLKFEKVNRGLLGGPLNLPRPPWEDLGYGSAVAHEGSSGWTVFGGSIYPWLVGIAILVALRFFRRRFARSGRTKS